MIIYKNISSPYASSHCKPVNYFEEGLQVALETEYFNLTFGRFYLDSIHESFSSRSLNNSWVKLLQLRNHDITKPSRMFSQFLLF